MGIEHKKHSLNSNSLDRRWQRTPGQKKKSTVVRGRETWRETQRVRERRGGERHRTAGETGHTDISSEKKMNQGRTDLL